MSSLGARIYVTAIHKKQYVSFLIEINLVKPQTTILQFLKLLTPKF